MSSFCEYQSKESTRYVEKGNVIKVVLAAMTGQMPVTLPSVEVVSRQRSRHVGQAGTVSSSMERASMRSIELFLGADLTYYILKEDLLNKAEDVEKAH